MFSKAKTGFYDPINILSVNNIKRIYLFLFDLLCKEVLHDRKFFLNKRTFINSDCMCAFESFAPMLVAAAQINSDIRKFFENTTSDGLVQIRDVISAFSNRTKKKLRETKNRVRDFMHKNSKCFFNRPISSIPFYNIGRFLDGLSILAHTIKSLIGLRCLESRECSACRHQVIVNRQ